MPINTLFEAVDRTEYDDKDMPEYPGLTLVTHVAFNTVLASTVVAATIAGGQTLFTKRDSSNGGFTKRLMRYSRNGVIAGVVLGSAMVLQKAASAEDMDADGIADRGYRLNNNPTTLGIKMYGVPSALVGSGACAMALPPSVGSIATRAIAGFGLGGVTGLLLVGIFKKVS